MTNVPNPNFVPRREPPPRLHPRKVRGGVKFADKADGTPPWAGHWAAERLVRLVESVVTGPDAVEGLQYARLGQTRTMTIDPGVVVASVQGRSDRPYSVRLSMSPFNDDQWHRIVKAMSEEAVYAAKLLAGELPSNIEDAFAPLALRLFPSEAGDLEVSCTCRRTWAQTPAAGEAPAAPRGTPTAGWCKHSACVAYLLAARLAGDALLMFTLRGMAGPDLIDRIRHTRAVSAAGHGAGLYQGRIPGVSESEPVPLEAVIDRFWDAGPELIDADGPIEAPKVTHPLLRRLGPSPFVNSSFPLVGLLASCYDAISADVLKQVEGGNGEGAEQEPDSGNEEG